MAKKVNMLRLCKVIFYICILLMVVLMVFMQFFAIKQSTLVNGIFINNESICSFQFNNYETDRSLFESGQKIYLSFDGKSYFCEGQLNKKIQVDYNLNEGKVVKYMISMEHLPKGIVSDKQYKLYAMTKKRDNLIKILLDNAVGT